MTYLSKKLFLGSLCQQLKKLNTGEIKEIEVGNLKDFRDYISIEDAVKKLLIVLKYGTSGEVYNIGSGKAIEITELLNKYLKKYKINNINIKENEYLNKSKVKIIFSNNNKCDDLIKKYK
jgi:GDP-4-dehydro-6-deoxy-D-mannose reductase